MEGQRALTWRKSTYSGNNGGQCIEVAARGSVFVRDSKDPHGPVLEVSQQMWRELTNRLKDSPR
ncbi:MAG TPA: DUF397 domain-containing protein [Streptosporangiaceae bacterium]|nr:DUF397 domain-containing protein [Streptosporangiaceae bacterium]